MNLRLGRFGLQESAAAVGLGALVSGVFSINVGETYEKGNVCYLATGAGLLLSLLLLLLLVKAMEARRVQSLIDVLDGLWPPLRYLFGVSLMLGFALCALLPLFRFTLAMERYIYVEADYVPMGAWMLPVLLLLVCLGMECIARTGKLMVISALISLVLTLALASPAFALHHLYPLFSPGWNAFLRQTLEATARFLPPGLGLLVVARGCQGLIHARKSLTVGLLLGGIGAVGMQLGVGLTFFATDLKEVSAPIYCMTMAARQERLALRLDVLVLFLWVLCGLVAAGFCIYGAALLFCALFHVQDIRPAGALWVLLVCGLLLLVNLDAAPIQTATAAVYSWGYWLFLLPVLGMLLMGRKV